VEAIVDSGGQWWAGVDIAEDSGGNSRQWWPIVTVVESTVRTVVDSGAIVDSGGQL
jgi:hypothetical protein